MRLLMSIFIALLLALPIWAQDQTGDCAGLSPAPLIVGEQGQVSLGQSNNVRDVPGRDGARIGQLPGGAQFEVLDGPVCGDGMVWWQIESDGLSGWTVDGMDGEQWLFPATALETEAVPLLMLSTTVITSENVALIQSNRTVNCDTGPEFSALMALGSRYVALNCGYYNINVPNSSLGERLMNDHLGIIDLETGVQVMTLSGEGSAVYPAAFLPNNRLLWFSQESSNTPIILHLSDVVTGEEINVAEIEEQNGIGLFVHPVFYANGTRFALFYQDDGDYMLHRWDATTLTLLQEQVFDKPEALDGSDVSFAISPDGERFALVYQVADSSELSIYVTANPRPAAVVSVPFVVFNNPAYLTFSPSGNFIVGAGCRTQEIACGNPVISWWSASDGTRVAEWEVPVNRSGRLRFSPDGNLLALGTTSGTVLYNVDSGDVAHVLPGDSHQTVFSADGTFIITQGDPMTTVWMVGE